MAGRSLRLVQAAVDRHMRLLMDVKSFSRRHIASARPALPPEDLEAFLSQEEGCFELTPDNFDQIVGRGKPALVELCV